ncbi:MAG: M23 family metallopeptidase [Bacteroidales bacterium]|nr:M23 family metallopeptidase [Bacteroidales bacterium]
MGRHSFNSILKSTVSYLSWTLLVAVVIYGLFSLIYTSDKERALAEENAYLKEHYDNLLERSNLVDDVLDGLEARDSKIYNSIFDIDPPSADALYGTDPEDQLERFYADSEQQLIDDSQAVVGELCLTAAQVDRQIRAITEQMEGENFSKNNFPSVIPLRTFTIAQTGATVGRKINPFFKSMSMHGGIDLMAPYGTEVLSTADGKVVEVLRQGRGLGNMVIIDHGNGLKTVYAHLSDIYVAINQKVTRGKVIGKVGNSGASFASALHYEVRKQGRAVDPVNYFFGSLSPALSSEMLLIANTTGQSLD